MTAYSIKRRTFMALTGALATTPLTTIAAEKPIFEWKLVTSWPKNSPGPGLTAERLAQRINTMSGGRLLVKVYGAGELVPALEVFDAVSRGTAELGHTASFFWRGKIPASVFFTTVPFGLIAAEHAAWINHGGGQALWEELYGDFGLQPFMAGNTGMGMGGWFKREINNLADLKGLKYRIPGLGGEVLKRLGATTVTLPPGEIFSALQAGVVDGAEWVGPWSDMALGLYKAAPYYYWPGFHEPNGTGECLVHRQSWAKLPTDLQAIVSNACAVEHAYSLAEAEWQNAEAVEQLVRQHGVKIRAFPQDVITAARSAASEVLAEFGQGDDISRRIYESYDMVRQRVIGWSRISTLALLKARAG
ncbi:MAG: TRAP transporter substrate-binding protein [Candidatus Competibacteraceae bacterium]|nr:TRAP transporter substrate-binding protein [Candidatus Competibacteraceae bacterium]